MAEIRMQRAGSWAEPCLPIRMNFSFAHRIFLRILSLLDLFLMCQTPTKLSYIILVE